jgi:pimeloyl-ACP methyl ester carboxylesterase
MMQLLAAAGHNKSEAQLRAMADKVGRERIAILHGTADNMIPAINGEKLSKFVEPGYWELIEGLGHAPMMERTDWFNEWLTGRIINCEKIDGRI